MKNKHWFDVCSQDIQQGEKEQKFFICLARDPKIVWKSVRIICVQTGLSEVDVEKVILKYSKIGMVVKNPDNDYEWAYYERVDVNTKEKLSITEENQNKRIREN